MRLAFIDPVFTWPPAGGAPLDLYHSILGLQRLGYTVALFHGVQPGDPLSQPVASDDLPFECIPVETSDVWEKPEGLAAKYRAAVDAYNPDAVFLGFGFFLKPYLAQTLRSYPQIGRYYAYEPFCPRDFRRFKEGAVCPKNYLVTPRACTACTMRAMGRHVLGGYPNPYALEYVNARAHAPAYHRLLLDTLRRFDAIAVNNAHTRDLLGDLNPNIHVVGGGVDLDAFPYCSLSPRPPGEKTVLLMTGRGDDPTKGRHILMKAAAMLAERRQDFELWITDKLAGEAPPWLRCLGWQTPKKLAQLYARADIAVFPSIWEEPFGLVALEAMAVGRPVVAADVGGLRDIVAHEKTGLRYPAMDTRALVVALARLLDDPILRCRMGEAGHARAASEFHWPRIIEQRYAPMIEQVLAGAGKKKLS